MRVAHEAPRTRPGLRSSIPARRPGYLLWVHCGEIDSYVDVAVRAGILDDGDADRYVAENARAAEVIGAAEAPRSRAEQRRTSPRFAAPPPDRRGHHGDDEPAHGAAACSVSVKLTQPPTAALAFATMPRWARRMYSSPGLPTTDLSATLALQALRAAVARLPGPPEPPRMVRARRLMAESRHPPPGPNPA